MTYENICNVNAVDYQTKDDIRSYTMHKRHKFCLLTAGALLFVTVPGAASAEAHSVTYVSGKGADSGDCTSPANPCRTFQFAVDHTVAGGEVKALDPANYFPVRINKSITITGVEGAGIDTSGGTAITLPTSGTITVHLDHTDSPRCQR